MPVSEHPGSGDDDRLPGEIRRNIRTPLTPSPGDFGLDRLWLEIRTERRMTKRRCLHRRMLRWYVRSSAYAVAGVSAFGTALRFPGNVPMNLQMMPSMISSAPPPIESSRVSRYARATLVSHM
jgi:hypothetical protein